MLGSRRNELFKSGPRFDLEQTSDRLTFKKYADPERNACVENLPITLIFHVGLSDMGLGKRG